MHAYLQFAASTVGPFQTCAVDDIEYRPTGVYVLWASRWRKVTTTRGRHYVNVGGQPVRVTIE